MHTNLSLNIRQVIYSTITSYLTIFIPSPGFRPLFFGFYLIQRFPLNLVFAFNVQNISWPIYSLDMWESRWPIYSIFLKEKLIFFISNGS